MQNPNNPISRWTSEYKNGGIPSSSRTTPSGAVVWGLERLQQTQFPLREAIDIGCGKGRNTLYLAQQGMHVTAMDFTPNAIQHLVQTASQLNIGSKIRALEQDVTEPWPVPEASMDLAIDAFCFKHIAPNSSRLAYKVQLLRALRSRGHYLVSFASIGDGYYGRYVVERSLVDGGEEHLAVDPVSGIESVLYTRKRVLQFFAPELTLFEELHKTDSRVMHGETYESSTYALLLQRNPHMA